MSTTPPASDQSLRDIHDGLVALVVHLDATIATAQDASQVETLTNQIDTLNAQVTELGEKLIDEQTTDITQALNVVSQVQAAAVKAVKAKAEIGAITDAAADCIGKVATLLRLL